MRQSIYSAALLCSTAAAYHTTVDGIIACYTLGSGPKRRQVVRSLVMARPNFETRLTLLASVPIHSTVSGGMGHEVRRGLYAIQAKAVESIHLAKPAASTYSESAAQAISHGKDSAPPNHLPPPHHDKPGLDEQQNRQSQPRTHDRQQFDSSSLGNTNNNTTRVPKSNGDSEENIPKYLRLCRLLNTNTAVGAGALSQYIASSWLCRCCNELAMDETLYNGILAALEAVHGGHTAHQV